MRSAGYLLWVLPICVYPAVAQTLTTLYSFQGTPDGGFPFSDVLLTKGGTLYSTTSGGGSNGAGSVFELVPPSQPGGEWTDKLLVSLPGGSGGGMPFAGVVEDDSGAFYSANAGTPPNELGNIFQVAPVDGGQSWTYNIIWHFSGSDGATPQADLLYRGGVFYGATTAGGAHNRGTIFMLAPPATAGGSWTHTLLYSFSNGADGGYPFSSLLMDQSGALYGTTSQGGGSKDGGTVFKLAPPVPPATGWTLTTLFTFERGASGGSPYDGVVMDKDGNLYGSAYLGGTSGDGVIFELSPPASSGDAWTETVLLYFNGENGSGPNGGVTLGPGGEVYGTAVRGGSADQGVVFVLIPTGGTWHQVLLHQFSGGGDGGWPMGKLRIDPHGGLLGTTYYGGAYKDGTVFSLTTHLSE